jgi:hypothetical protein
VFDPANTGGAACRLSPSRRPLPSAWFEPKRKEPAMRLPRTVLAVLLLAGVRPAAAADLLPPTVPVEQAVDHYIDANLKEAGVAPAPAADDATLVRRLTLDLAGRIPTLAETKAFVESREPDKRVRLVDRLMASPAFVRHQADEFDALLMAGTKASIREYLLQAFADNRNWDRIFRELMLPDEKDPRRKGASGFLRQRLADTDKMTADVSSLFFGVNISCARCHDHPLVHDWKQDHFFGMKSFFHRTFEAGGAVAERDSGVVKFKTKSGPERVAKMMFLTGKVVDDPGANLPVAAPPKKGNKQTAPAPPPKWSARAQLVDLALQAGQRDFFARSLVNRVWHRFFGFGLVVPLDQMHSENPPSHPELLAWLARDTAEHGYDLRRLTRGLVLSRAYARSSRWEGSETPRPQLFAVARLRALAPMQLATSLRLAVTDPQTLPADLKPEEFDKRIGGLESSARGFASLFEQPGDDFQIGVGEALLFSNGERVQKDLLADGGDRLLGRLLKMKDSGEAIDLVVRTVLCRPPTAAEKAKFADFVRARADRPADAYRELLWAMLTCSEFRFNY